MITTNKVAIYVRVSTTNQVEEGYSIDEQKDKLTAFCKIKDWAIYNIYTDGGFTGSNTHRPALEQLVKDAKSKKFDTVLVYKLDRLSRSQKDTLYLIEDVFLTNDIDFVSLLENFDTSTPFGKAMVGILSVFAQLEREQIKERMQLGKLGRAKAGKSMMWAKTSYGYDYNPENGEMTINPYQSVAIKEIFYHYLSGISITKLRDALNDSYPKKPAWSYRIIRQILANPVYCGYNQYKGEIYKGNHEPIISKENFDEVQKELKIRQRKAAEYSNPRPFQAKYMLSGLAKCGYCGAPQKIIMGARRKVGDRIKRYECYQRHPRKTKGVTVYNNNEKCHSGSYLMIEIEQYVLTEISKLQNNPTEIDALFETQEEAIDRVAIQKQIDLLTDKISRLNDLYIDDRITLEELQKKSTEFGIQKTLLEGQLENDPGVQSQERKEKMVEVLKCDNIFNLDYDMQKKIVNTLIDRVVVTAEKISINWKL